MLIKLVVAEYLNHFFSYEELSEYLNISIEEISSILDNSEVILKELGPKTVDKVKRQKLLIKKWRDERDSKVLNISSDSDVVLVKVVKDMIETNDSIRKASKKFGLSKSYLHDHIESDLPMISITLYKKLFDVLKGNKSIKATLSKAKEEEIIYEYELSKSGKSIEEIALIMETSPSSVERNLAKRLHLIDQNMGDDAKNILSEHKQKIVEYQFKPKNN